MSAWGNYHGYQGSERHHGSAPAASHVPDARLVLLEAMIPDLFTAKHILDIGCNAGKVTVDLGLHFHASYVLGVDIDPDLVIKARQHFRFRSSRTRPPVLGQAPDVYYFPVSAVLEHGVRDAPSLTKTDEGYASQESTVEFRAEDWPTASSPNSSGPFDIILALSVVKWIHLEHGDDGLKALFSKCGRCIHPNGYLVMEIQPWKSYKNAVSANKTPQFRSAFESLQLRPEDFDSLLGEVGFNLVQSSSEREREIKVYRKIR